jgi:gliding motility-associated-like protein
VDVTELPKITFGLQVDSVTCLQQGKITVINLQNGVPPFSYQLDNNAPQATDSFPGLSGGSYTIKVIDSKNCSATATATLTAPTPIVLELGNNATIQSGQTYAIPGTLSNAQTPLTFNWTPTDSLSCTDCVNPVAGPDSTTTYFLSVTDNRGCTANDSITITLFEIFNLFVPNVFTPNLDGLNDVFGLLYASTMTEFKMMIFNRWGQKIFETSNVTEGWDGTYKGERSPVDSYVYYIIAVTKTGERKEYKGTITLLR